MVVFLFYVFRDFIYLFLERGGGRKGRETSMCGCLSHAPHKGPGQQSRHVPQQGIEPAILWFAGQCSTHWATLSRADSSIFDVLIWKKIKLGKFSVPNFFFLKCCYFFKSKSNSAILNIYLATDLSLSSPIFSLFPEGRTVLLAIYTFQSSLLSLIIPLQPSF